MAKVREERLTENIFSAPFSSFSVTVFFWQIFSTKKD